MTVQDDHRKRILALAIAASNKLLMDVMWTVKKMSTMTATITKKYKWN